MRIVFRKISDDRHALAVIREAGAREAGAREEVECETRSCLEHDFIHYAVEAEAGLDRGFWGALAAGATLAAMSDRTGRALVASTPEAVAELAIIEPLVGALSGVTKGRTAAELAAGIRRFGEARGAPLPDWLTEPFIAAVLERTRQLTGRWRATPYGGSMELPWPAADEPTTKKRTLKGSF